MAERPPALPASRLMRGGKPAAIVPEGSIALRALVVVIAIMTFLSCLTLGAVMLVRESAQAWQSQISREATIQIRPGDFDMEAALEQARLIALEFSGVTGAEIVSLEDTGQLLEPWLGSGVNMSDLPVPRLIIITIDETGPPDFAGLGARISAEVPGASFDDHRKWVDRLVSMARTLTRAGLAVLLLMLVATALTVVFATRGAMAGSGHIIEVLHFVGARPSFIAGEFRRHFIKTGLIGAAAGGIAALAVFLATGWWASSNRATPEADQVAALFGNMELGYQGLATILLIVLSIVAIAAATSHLTVHRHLSGMGNR